MAELAFSSRNILLSHIALSLFKYVTLSGEVLGKPDGYFTDRSLVSDVNPMESWDSLECGPELNQVYLATEYFHR